MFATRFIVFFLSFVLTSVLAAPINSRAAVKLNVANCTARNVKLNTHDCDVALLGLGGGIAGKIQFLRVNAASTTAVSGTCRVTATAVNGGTTIDISKGRLEGHGSSNGGFDNLRDACGTTPGSMIIGGGSNNGGDIEIAISKA
ncbi:unnamed protein product [Mycena citricolor]|uniref:Uncharacterized protein n=1 Tax=Mycena citricolor TaxID=2018698 RepID=A0AAD2H5P8_9AGAR|nr:unnamed protein product [Mycena citricolor]